MIELFEYATGGFWVFVGVTTLISILGTLILKAIILVFHGVSILLKTTCYPLHKDSKEKRC